MRRGDARFAYNAAGRLVRATTESGITEYGYNALGQRVIKRSPTTTSSPPYTGCGCHGPERRYPEISARDYLLQRINANYAGKM